MLLMNYELTMNYVSPSGEWINKCAIGGSAAAKYQNGLDGSAASAFFHGACGKYRKLPKTTENNRKQPKTYRKLPKSTEINLKF